MEMDLEASNNEPPSTVEDHITENKQDDSSDEISPRPPHITLTPMETFATQLESITETLETECTKRLDALHIRLRSTSSSLSILKGWVSDHIETKKSLEKQLDESNSKCKSLLQKWSREKEERRIEKEWIADVWPDYIVVPPTILKPFIKSIQSEEEKQQLSENAKAKMRLAEEANRVRERISLALQWSAVDNYYYNSVTGESCWEMPSTMQYVPPKGWDSKRQTWHEGVVLTLTESEEKAAALPPPYKGESSPVVSARSEADPSDSDAEAMLNPIDLRAQFQVEQTILDKLSKDSADCELRLQTISHQLQKALRRQIDDERSAVQAEIDAVIEAERKRRTKEARDRKAALMEAQAKAEEARGKKKVNGGKLQAAELVVDIDMDVQVPEDPNRQRLCTPVSSNNTVRFHLKSDEMYHHMEAVQVRVEMLVQLEDSIWEAHDAFRESIEKELSAARKTLEDMVAELERSSATLELSKARYETIKVADPMPTLESVVEEEGRTKFEVYDEQMKKWEDIEISRRMECEELQETITEYEGKVSQANIQHLKDEIQFFEQLEACEVERGAGLWSKKQKYQVWRTKLMLDRVEREERLVGLTEELRGFTVEAENSNRIPLQAINLLERTELESRAISQQEYYAKKVNDTKDEIERHEAARVKLMEMELHALEFNTLRLEEEKKLHDETKGVYLEQKVTFDPTQQRLLRSWLKLNYTREKRWRTLVSYDQIDESPWLEQDKWLVSQQRARFDSTVSALEEKHAARVYELEQEIKKLQVQVHIANDSKKQSDQDKSQFKTIVIETDARVEQANADAIAYLQDRMDALVEKMKEQEIFHQERIDRLLNEHSIIREDLERRLDESSADATLRMQWLKAVKCELSDHKVLNKHLLCGIAALEKRRATEINDMQARIMSQLSRIHRLEMWNRSLRQSIEANNDILLQHQQNLEKRVKEHRAEQRILRREVWRQRISAQLLLTNAHHLLSFFLQGVAGLCGHANDALRDAAIIPVLVELCKIQTLPSEIRYLATSSLGKLAWNSPKSLRYIGWQAKTIWGNWVKKLSEEATYMLQECKCEFDDTVSSTDVAMNLSADFNNHEKYQTHLDRLCVLRETQYWVSQSEIPSSINEVNVLSIGDTSGAIAILVELSCTSTIVSIQEGAMASLATLAMHSRNIQLIGRYPGFLSKLIKLCESAPTLQMQIHALHSLTNLSYKNKTHHDNIYSHHGVEALLRIACSSHDVDVIDLSTAALANLTESHQASIINIIESGGMLQLLSLSMQSYLCDVVEDGRMDTIQGNISLCVVHLLHANPESVLTVWQTTPTFLNLALSLIASGHIAVQAAAIMVLGVVSQHNEIRGHLGDVGVVALLISFLQASKIEMIEQTSWTLLQLSWNRDNQTRLSAYWDEWYRICSSTSVELKLVQQHIFQLVGNLVFYHPENRTQMIQDTKWISFMLEICSNHNVTWRLDAVRTLCALSYDNEFATACHHIATIVDVLQQKDETEMILHGLQWLSNLLVHDVQKSRFVHCPSATETLVSLCGAEVPSIRQRAQEVLDLVADIRLQTKISWKP